MPRDRHALRLENKLIVEVSMHTLRNLLSHVTSNARRADDPDGDLRTLMRDGKQVDAIRLLMHRHGTAVYRYCRESINDGERADRAHRQVFIHAFHHLSRIPRGCTVKTWLFAVARLQVLDDARGSCTGRASNEGHLGVCDARSSIADLDEQQLGELLAAAMADLDAELRSVALLRHQQQFSLAEMSVICGRRARKVSRLYASAYSLLWQGIESRLVTLRPDRWPAPAPLAL